MPSTNLMRWSLAAALIFTLSAFAAAPSAPPVAAPVDQSGPTILQTYKAHFLIGAAGDVPGGFTDQELNIVKGDFNVITPENYLKPATVHPLEDVWSFRRPDALVNWCAANNIAVHGHTLVWHSQTNPWFFEGNDKETTIKRLKEHITTLVGRYKGKIRSWDVVNEAINDGGGVDTQTENLRNSRWLQIIGPEFLTLAFKFAHEADPGAQLYYNDYGIENGNKHLHSMVLLKRLIKDGAPIHGVGIQGHWSTNGLPYAALDKAIADYASLGLKVAISELDLTVAGVSGGQLDPAVGGGGARRGRGAASGPATAPVPAGFAARGTGRGGARGAAGGAQGAAPVNPAANVQEVVTDLTPEQKTRLTPVSDDVAVKLAQWQKSSQAALLSVQPQYTPGQVAYQFEVEEFNAEQAKQNAFRDEIINDAEIRVLAVLTPAQAEKWEASRLDALFTAKFGTLNVTDAQKSQIALIISATAKKLAAARDKAVVASAHAEFSTKVLGALDEAQVQQYQAQNAPGAGRGGARGGRGGGAPSAAGLKAQADAYARIFAILLKHKQSIDRVTFWGLNDARSWRTGQNPLVFDANNQRKPAYNAIVDALLHPDPTLSPPP